MSFFIGQTVIRSFIFIHISGIAVGIPIARYPPHGSVRALISAYGS
jgi:hypothetical protein